jgi:hypothetical protein
MDGTPAPLLLAIVEVEQDDRVRCQAPDCGHTVHKRIHVVRERDGGVGVYGPECFGRLFERLAPRKVRPRFGTKEGRKLTAEECAMLTANTERLIAQFEAEEVDRLEREAAERAAVQKSAPPPQVSWPPAPPAGFRFPPASEPHPRPESLPMDGTLPSRPKPGPAHLTPYQERQARREALRVLRQRPELRAYGEAAVANAMVQATAMCLGWGLQMDRYTQETIDIEAERILKSAQD